eukprot:14135-Heterococcus_DN1.PRE.3
MQDRQQSANSNKSASSAAMCKERAPALKQSCRLSCRGLDVHARSAAILCNQRSRLLREKQLQVLEREQTHFQTCSTAAKRGCERAGCTACTEGSCTCDASLLLSKEMHCSRSRFIRLTSTFKLLPKL